MKKTSTPTVPILVEELSKIFERRGVLKHIDAQKVQQLFAESTLGNFEDFLLDTQLVDKNDLLQALGEYYQTTAIDARAEFFDNHLLRMFPIDLMVRRGFAPFRRDGNVLIVVASNPHDDTLTEAIGKFVSYAPLFWVGIRQDIIDVAREFYDISPTAEPTDIDRRNEEKEEHAFEHLGEFSEE